MPDGDIPTLLIDKWGVWVRDCTALLDGDGTFRHWKYKGARADQPYIDLIIYDVIRQKWAELKNAKVQSQFPTDSKSGRKTPKRSIGKKRGR